MTACTRSGQDRVADTAAAVSADARRRSQQPGVDPDPVGAARSRIGVVFDPSHVRVGDTIGELVVEKIVARRTPMDSTFVGTAAFRGEIEVTGRTLRHPEADASNDVCFEADSASAARLPRWAGDRRRTWFCFWNPAKARRALGADAAERRLRIVIANFVIHRGLTDEVNAARFVRLVGHLAVALYSTHGHNNDQ